MLILSRKIGETIIIGERITMTVLGVKGNQVRLGINAPREVAVHREEIFLRRRRLHPAAGAGAASGGGPASVNG